MGQAHSSGSYFHETTVKDHFASIQVLWSEEDLSNLISRLKDMTLNFSLDKVKFAKLLQLSTTHEDLVAKWFQEFSHDRASQVVDGLEFLSASIMLSSKVGLFRKICLLFGLFDLDKTGVIRKDEFTIFLKAVTTGLHRMVNGLPPPASVLELGSHSAEFFSTLSSQVLSKHDLLMWMTEAHFSLHYLSVLSTLGEATFAWGSNSRYQLGLNLEPAEQRTPAPVLTMEGIRIKEIASNESHTLFLTEDGKVFSCGSGFCGILGHGNLDDSPQPKMIEALAHSTIKSVAVGVRHSCAVSDKGQVFTWGSADMYQLGHGSFDDAEVHQSSYDPKTGGRYYYVYKPTVVMSLFGKKIFGTQVSCCNYSTCALTSEGHLYTWGNNTDGQCAQGQKCTDHRLVYVDSHMHRTAMQAVSLPRKVETNAIFQDIRCGGYHTLAIDLENKLWTWGQGMWGKLGHGDQRSMYEPKLVDSLKYQITQELAAGESHSLCLCSLFRLTITGASASTSLSPFSLLALPTGRVDRHAQQVQPTTPPNSQLQLSAFASGRLLQVGLPFRHEAGVPIVNPDAVGGIQNLQDSIVLIDRALWEGEWLKLATTDFDFCIKLSSSGAAISQKTGLQGPLVVFADGKYDAETDFAGNVCVFEVATPSTYPTGSLSAGGSGGFTDGIQGAITTTVLQLAQECAMNGAKACICILPKEVEVYNVVAPDESLRSVVFAVVNHHHGAQLKTHVARLVNMRIAESTDGVPEEVRNWREKREDFTGRPYYENTSTGAKRWAPPVVLPRTEASLLIVREDAFLTRLKGMVDLQPKAIIVCQQSWKPDVQMVDLPNDIFNLETLETPIAMVTYEAGEELKSVFANGSEPWISMEMQPYGGVCSWGNGTEGQLGLAGIENQVFLQKTQNSLTQEEHLFSSTPCYVAHLHEHQVLKVACGSMHTTAVTQQGEVFAWGLAEGLGVPIEKPTSDVPMFVDQLEGLVRATKAFAGHNHSYVLAEMPFPTVV